MVGVQFSIVTVIGTVLILKDDFSGIKTSKVNIYRCRGLFVCDTCVTVRKNIAVVLPAIYLLPVVELTFLALW